jgi:hypothetical protein
MPALTPTPITDRTLDEKFLHELRQRRPLQKYTLRFVNPEYPILSFLYAVTAGGEYTLYCDYTEDYVKEYLGYDVLTNRQDPGYRISDQQRAALFEVLARLDGDRYKDPPPYPNRDEWRKVMEQLLEELDEPKAPRPMPLW